MATSARASGTVADWLEARSDHPDLAVLVALCDLISATDPRLTCEIKWNAPSYAIVDHFATTGLMPKGGVRLVLHAGAAKRAEPLRLRDRIGDPGGLLQWKEPDRAIVMFSSLQEVEDARQQLGSILAEWIELTR